MGNAGGGAAPPGEAPPASGPGLTLAGLSPGHPPRRLAGLAAGAVQTLLLGSRRGFLSVLGGDARGTPFPGAPQGASSLSNLLSGPGGMGAYIHGPSAKCLFLGSVPTCRLPGQRWLSRAVAAA